MGCNIDPSGFSTVNHREVDMYKMRWHNQLLFLVTVFFGSGKLAVWGLSCVEGALSISRKEAIRESYCYSNVVYVGRVIGATCNCLEDSSTARCLSYRLDLENSAISTRLLAHGKCHNEQLGSGLQTCRTVGNSIVSWGLRVEGDGGVAGNVSMLNLSSSIFGCRLACPFNNGSGEIELQPCIYSVSVTEVFKGNYSVGEVVEVTGPNVLIAGTGQRVLQIYTTYLVGIGGLCSPVAEWSAANSFSSDEVSMLKQNVTCAQTSGLVVSTLTNLLLCLLLPVLHFL